MIDSPTPLEPERRRRERRINARVADLTIPEMRRLLVTTLLSSIVVVLFLYMVRRVIVAGVLGAIIGVYVRPLYSWFHRGVSMVAVVPTLDARSQLSFSVRAMPVSPGSR